MFKNTIEILTNLQPLLFQGILTTLSISLLASCIGLFFGIIFGILTCDKLKNPFFSSIINLYVLVIRGTPLYVQILISYFVLPNFLSINITPFCAGLIALGCNSIAYVCEIVRGGINSIHPGQWEACTALCYPKYLTIKSIILPQAFKNILPNLTNEVVTLFKDSSIVGVIGVFELTKVSTIISAKTLDPLTIYTITGLIYLFFTTLITFLSKNIEKGLKHD